MSRSAARLAAIALLAATTTACGSDRATAPTPPPANAPAAGTPALLTFNGLTRLEVAVGDSTVVRATLFDAVRHVLSTPAITYSSSAPSVVRATADGSIVALAGGSATITAAAAGFTASYTVSSVAPVAPARLVIHPADPALVVGATGSLWAHATDAAGERLRQATAAFTSSDPSILAVDAAGRLRALAPGVATVTATVNGVAATTTVQVTHARALDFPIELVFHGPLAADPEFQAVAREAAERWQRVLVGTFPERTLSLPTDACAPRTPALSRTTAGVVILVGTDSMHPRIAGYAGPCAVRAGGDVGAGLAVVGTVTLNRDFADPRVNATLLRDLLTHEIGHVLGLGTSTWHSHLAGSAGARHFTGPAALAAHRALGFPDATVLVESEGGPGTADAHWENSRYGREVMVSGLQAGGMLLSRLSAAALHDLGYSVDLAGADLTNAAALDPQRFGPANPASPFGAFEARASRVAPSHDAHGDRLTAPRYTVGVTGDVVALP